METDIQLYIEAERMEMEALKVLCEPFTGNLVLDGNIYFHQFSPHCIALVSGSDLLFANRVFGIGIDEPVNDYNLKCIISFFRKAGKQKFFVQPSPVALQPGVPELLTENGGVHYSNWVKLVKPAKEHVAVNEEITVRVARKENAEAIATILLNAFSWPPELRRFCTQGIGRKGWTNYIALLGNNIEGTASVFVDNENVELAMAATNTAARGHGIQSALIGVRAAFAQQRNCKYLFVETAEPTANYPAPSWRNMIRLHFTELYRRPNYLFKI